MVWKCFLCCQPFYSLEAGEGKGNEKCNLAIFKCWHVYPAHGVKNYIVLKEPRMPLEAGIYGHFLALYHSHSI